MSKNRETPGGNAVCRVLAPRWRGEPAHLLLFGAFDRHQIAGLVLVRALATLRRYHRVVLDVDSPGGTVVLARLLDKLPICETIVHGVAASAATMSFHRGRRVSVYPNARVMIHEAHYNGFRGSQTILDEVNRDMLRRYHIKTGKDKRLLAMLMKRETYFDALTAVQFGLADQVINDDTEAHRIWLKWR